MTIENKILSNLVRRWPGKVSLVVLAKNSNSFNVNSHVKNLREAGFKIKHYLSNKSNKKGYYQLMG